MKSFTAWDKNTTTQSKDAALQFFKCPTDFVTCSNNKERKDGITYNKEMKLMLTPLGSDRPDQPAHYHIFSSQLRFYL
jgi:hypothetical protein